MPRKSDAKERLMNAAMDLIWEHSYGSDVGRRHLREGRLRRRAAFITSSNPNPSWPSQRLEADWQRKKGADG